MLAYGALDELASGCWSREGGTVTLVASKFETSMEDPLKFDRLELRALRKHLLNIEKMRFLTLTRAKKPRRNRVQSNASIRHSA